MTQPAQQLPVVQIPVGAFPGQIVVSADAVPLRDPEGSTIGAVKVTLAHHDDAFAFVLPMTSARQLIGAIAKALDDAKQMHSALIVPPPQIPPDILGNGKGR